MRSRQKSRAQVHPSALSGGNKPLRGERSGRIEVLGNCDANDLFGLVHDA
jgi:hypothetical protein